jgi:hypothetical protein
VPFTFTLTRTAQGTEDKYFVPGGFAVGHKDLEIAVSFIASSVFWSHHHSDRDCRQRGRGPHCSGLFNPDFIVTYEGVPTRERSPVTVYYG